MLQIFLLLFPEAAECDQSCLGDLALPLWTSDAEQWGLEDGEERMVSLYEGMHEWLTAAE